MWEFLLPTILGAIIGGFFAKYFDHIATWFWNRTANRHKNSFTYYKALQSSLKKSIKEINKETFINHRFNQVDVKVVNADSPDLDFYGDKIILRVSTKYKVTENLERLLRLYTREVILDKVYGLLNNIQKESIEDFIGKEISSKTGQPKVTEKFDDLITEKTTDDKKYGEYHEKYLHVRKNGLLFTIFLPEIRRMGKIVSSAIESDKRVQKNYDELLDFLHRISTKKAGEKVPLQFTSKLSKIGVILVADDATWASFREEAYVRRAKYLIKNGLF